MCRRQSTRLGLSHRAARIRVGGHRRFSHLLFRKEEQAAIKEAWIEREKIHEGGSLNIQLSTLGCVTTTGTARAILVGEVQKRESSTGREMLVVLRVKPMKMGAWDRLLVRHDRVALRME